MFIDIHNHILNGIDDGAKSYEDTLTMLKKAENDQIKKLIFTPHFAEGVFENNANIIHKKIEEAKEIIKRFQIDIEVYPGSEIFLTQNTNALLNKKVLQTINHSNRILIETHRLSQHLHFNVNDELYNISVDGYQPIIAHPERYQYVHQNPNHVFDWVSEGYLIQLNVDSIIDPKRPQFKLAKRLLDHNLVHFIASDAHGVDHRPPILSFGYELIKNKYGINRANELFYDNPLKLIKNQKISISGEKIKEKKWFF